MSRSESWKTWAVVIAILLFSGFVAAVWPLLTSIGGGASVAITFEPETVTIAIPSLPGLEGGQVITLPSLVVFMIIAVLVIGAVIVTGLIISFLITPLSKQVVTVENSEEFQEQNANLEQREKEKLSKEQEGRAAATVQQHDYSRWAVVATSMAILMFSVFLGFLFGSTLFPSGRITEQDQIINVTGIITAIFFLVTLFILLLRMNPRRLAAVDETDSQGIPWDTIVIILLGVLILGLGIGLVVFLNRPL